MENYATKEILKRRLQALEEQQSRLGAYINKFDIEDGVFPDWLRDKTGDLLLTPSEKVPFTIAQEVSDVFMRRDAVYRKAIGEAGSDLSGKLSKMENMLNSAVLTITGWCYYASADEAGKFSLRQQKMGGRLDIADAQDAINTVGRLLNRIREDHFPQDAQHTGFKKREAHHVL